MKTLIQVALLGLTLVATPVLGQESYPIACRGSDDMNILTMVGATTDSPSSVEAMNFTFKRAEYGALVKLPNPGYCAWMDRAVSGKEPTQMQASSTILTPPMRTPNRPLTILRDWLDSGDVFYVHAYNNRAGYLVITKLGL